MEIYFFIFSFHILKNFGKHVKMIVNCKGENMILTKVDINNFRSIKKQVLDFSIDTCKILVGINEAGKSNILKALSSINKKYGADCIRHQSSGEDIKDYNITFYFKLSQLEKESIVAALSKLFFNIDAKNFFVNDDNEKSIYDILEDLIIKIKETSKKQHDIEYDFDSFNFSTNVVYATIKSAISQSMLPEGYLLENVYFISDDYNSEFYDSKTFDQTPFKNKFQAIIKDLVDKQTKKVVFWEFKEENLLPSEIKYQTFLTNVDSNQTLKSLFEIANKENWETEILSKITNDKLHVNSYLKNTYSKTILKYFKEKWPELDIKELSITNNGEYLEFAFIDQEDNEYYANERSDGFKRFITFLILISGKNTLGDIKDTILLVDEPDIAIHIKGQTFLLQELLRISENNIVVFSTHSPFMIDKSNIGRHYIVKKQKEVTSLTVSTDSNFSEEEVLFQALGYTIFCNIKNKNILFEGYWDNFVFNKMKDNRFNHIGHIYMGGVKNAQSVGKMIELQDKEYTIISDSDRPAKDKKAEFKKECSGKWIEYGEINPNIFTLEDFVKNERIKKSLTSVLKLKDYTTLKTLDLSFVDNLTTKKLDIITNTCYRHDNSLDKKKFQNKLKEKIFNNINNDDILTDYNDFLEFVLTL